MRRSRLAVTFCLLLASISTFAFAGPIGISDYSGPRFPFSASFVTSSSEVDFEPPYEHHDTRYGYWLDDGGARSVSRFLGDPSDMQGTYHSAPSATDPAVVYLGNAFISDEIGKGIVAVRFDGNEWYRVSEIPFKQPIRNSFHSYVTILADRNGSDVLFFRPQSDSLAVAIDSDGDHIADRILDRNGDSFDDEIKFGSFPVAAIGPDGTAYGFDFIPGSLPEAGRTFATTILDTNGDFIPDSPAWPSDPRGRVEVPGLTSTSTSGTVEASTDRLIFGGLPGVILLDGNGFPIPSTFQRVAGYELPPGDRTSVSASVPQSLLHDGTLAAYWAYFDDFNVPADSNHGVYILDDVNFDGYISIRPSSQGSELLPALTEKMFEPAERPESPTVPCLTELRSFAGGFQSITFADFGIWPDGRAFSFRQASVEQSSVSVSLDGLLSFVGPVAASPSLAALDTTPGLVAPAWSDQWDTSQVRVFVGCAPTQRRFADGSGSTALSFVIEWRGLISPNGKRTSLRCLLLEDGSFRVDYGAMEIGSMPLVVGYSTDGSGAIVSDDLSDNSWGGLPAGTLEEAKLGEEFGAAKPFDLQHKWIRFSGYGDVRGPRPELISVVLRKGNKIQMRATGSNIQTGATLVVDGTETFELAKSATGSKWVVSKKAVSTPGVRSVASIWGDGQPHTLVVVNPDGGHSDLLTLQ